MGGSWVEIKYVNQKVERCFCNPKITKKIVGEKLARMIKKRFDQLKAASNFDIYLSTRLGKPHSLVGNFEGCYGITISSNYRLVVRPEIKGTDSVSLKECDTIIIEGVVDYHGQKTKWLIP